MTGPATGHRGALGIRIEEWRGAQPLVHARSPARGHQHHRRRIDQQCPERAMGQRVPTGHAEQLLRAQPGDAERAILHPAGVHPAGHRHRWQQQRVQPRAEAQQHARLDAAAAGATPVQAADQPRCELRHGSERHQAVAGQGAVIAAAAVVAVGHQRQQQDRQPADPQNARGDVGGFLVITTSAQQYRHHQVVADHGGQRDRGHDHHAGRRGEAPDVSNQRQCVAPFRQRQGQHHRVIGHATAGTEQADTGGGDRQHHRRDEHQVAAEHPARTAYVAHIPALDHRYVELARQADDGEEAEQRLRQEAHRRQPGEQRMHRLHHRFVAVAEPDVGEHAHRHHRHQLDHGLQRNGQHHAVVMLGGIDLAGTDQGGEQRHQQGHVQRRVAEEAGRAGVAGQHLQAHRHRFVLQGQVRNDADQRDDRHQRCQPPRAAETRRDEIGDGDHVLAARDQRQALDDAPAEQQQQQGADIDRQIAHTVAHGGAHRAVEGPRRAVHRQRQAATETSSRIQLETTRVFPSEEPAV
ncbi:hypothetical protein G6F57_011604 [Rhizopus arrhizus]|nr:hypothetical protein G6F57_011604 [Rhizopus arrhizus]